VFQALKDCILGVYHLAVEFREGSDPEVEGLDDILGMGFLVLDEKDPGGLD
jgi:hypothetical protein